MTQNKKFPDDREFEKIIYHLTYLVEFMYNNYNDVENDKLKNKNFSPNIDTKLIQKKADLKVEVYHFKIFLIRKIIPKKNSSNYRYINGLIDLE